MHVKTILQIDTFRLLLQLKQEQQQKQQNRQLSFDKS